MPNSSPALIAMKFLNKRQLPVLWEQHSWWFPLLSPLMVCVSSAWTWGRQNRSANPAKISENYFNNSVVFKINVSSITWPCYSPTDNFLPHQKASQASSASARHSSCKHWWEPSNYFRGSEMLNSFIHFCKIHSDTCLHTLVSLRVCLFLNIHLKI